MWFNQFLLLTSATEYTVQDLGESGKAPEATQPLQSRSYLTQIAP